MDEEDGRPGALAFKHGHPDALRDAHRISLRSPAEEKDSRRPYRSEPLFSARRRKSSQATPSTPSAMPAQPRNIGTRQSAFIPHSFAPKEKHP